MKKTQLYFSFAYHREKKLFTLTKFHNNIINSTHKGGSKKLE